MRLSDEIEADRFFREWMQEEAAPVEAHATCAHCGCESAPKPEGSIVGS